MINPDEQAISRASMTAHADVPALPVVNGTQQPSLQKTASIFAGANILSLMLSMSSGLLVARFSNPSDLGLFNGVTLVLGYVALLQLGAISGLNRELPYFIGRGERAEAEGYAAAAEAWTLCVGGIASVALLFVSGWYAAHADWQRAVGYGVVAFSSFGLLYATTYLQVTYRTRGEFVQLSGINVAKNVTALLSAGLVLLWGYYGLCARQVLLDSVNLVLHWRGRPVRVRPQWNAARLLHLLKVGAPIFASGQLYVWWTVLDSTLVLSQLGTRQLGLYQLVLIASSVPELLYSSLGQVVYPRMAESYGRRADIHTLIQYLIKPLSIVVLVTIPMLAIGWFALPRVVTWLLPQYVEATSAAQWSLLSAAPLALIPLSNFFAVIKRMQYYVGSMAIGIVAYLLVLGVQSRHGLYLVAFPQALLIGRAVMIVLALVGAAHAVARCRAPGEVG